MRPRALSRPMRNFYPRPPRGGRRSTRHESQRHRDFYPRPPRGGRPMAWADYRAGGGRHFYPRPPRGGRHAQERPETGHGDFYPRPPRGGRPTSTTAKSMRWNFYPRPPRGGRPGLFCFKGVNILFLSTPSARRATSSHSPRNTEPSDFYPRPPRGGRPKPVDYKKEDIPISIHALREEGDSRGAWKAENQKISIHALREEGDKGRSLSLSVTSVFLSTPSARRATLGDILML